MDNPCFMGTYYHQAYWGSPGSSRDDLQEINGWSLVNASHMFHSFIGSKWLEIGGNSAKNTFF